MTLGAISIHQLPSEHRLVPIPVDASFAAPASPLFPAAERATTRDDGRISERLAEVGDPAQAARDAERRGLEWSLTSAARSAEVYAQLRETVIAHAQGRRDGQMADKLELIDRQLEAFDRAMAEARQRLQAFDRTEEA